MLEPIAKPRGAAVAFIFVTIVLDMLTFGMIVPVLPKLVVEFSGGDTAHGAAVYGLFGTGWALMQFLFSPIQGALSDRFGRRPVVLLSNVGLGLDCLLMAWAPSLAWLFVGRLISGVTAASVSTANAYIADVTPPDKRAAAYGLLGAAFGIGFILGPAIGGVLGTIDPKLPFKVAAVVCLANALYGYFVLPESLPPEKRSAFSWRRASPAGSLALLRGHPEVFGLASATFFYNIAHAALPSIFVLYTSYRFGWNERDVGLTLAAVGLSSMIVQGGLIRPIIKLLGERRALVGGLLCGAASFAIYGLAPSGAWVYLGVVVGAMWGIANPSAQTLMTRQIAAGEQGQLQGALSSLQGIASMIGPALFTQIFAAFIGPLALWHLPGAPMLLAAGFLIAAAAMAARATRGMELAKPT